MLSNAVCMTLRVRSVSAVRSCTSLNRRSVSMAITAWSAKVEISSICAGVNGRGLSRVIASTPIGVALAHQRHAEHGAVFAELLRPGPGVFGIGLDVGNVHDGAIEHGAAAQRIAARRHPLAAA